jgi:hypothetical protein
MSHMVDSTVYDIFVTVLATHPPGLYIAVRRRCYKPADIVRG